MKRQRRRIPNKSHRQLPVRFIADTLIPRLHSILLSDSLVNDSIYNWVYAVLEFPSDVVHEVCNTFIGPEDLYQELQLLYCKYRTATSRTFIWQVINWTRVQVSRATNRIEISSEALEQYRLWQIQGHDIPTSDEINIFPDLRSVLFNSNNLCKSLSTKDRYMIYLLFEGYSVRQIASKILRGKSQTHEEVTHLRDILKRKLYELTPTDSGNTG